MTERTAKRRLRNFDFSQEGAHLALVHKDQGGAANGYSTLIMKSTGQFSPEFIKKMQMIRVTMELDDFLEKFFGLWGSDAKVLAALLGYDESQELDTGVYNDDSFWEWWEDQFEDGAESYRQPTDEDKKKWLAYRLEGIEIIKSLKDPETRLDVLAGLSEDNYLAVIKEQLRFEKALNAKATSGGKKPVKKAEKTKKSQSIVNKADKAVTKEDNPMTDSVQPELIEKAQLEAVEKAYQAQVEELKKAQEQIEKYKQAEKASIAKLRKASVLEAVEAEAEAEKLFKAVGELSDENFQAVVEVVKALAVKADAGSFFTEQGSPNEGEQVQKSALRAQLENKYKKQ